MTPENDTNSGLLLNGLDGANPLAFLAALGTLRVINEHKTVSPCDGRMFWKQNHGYWSPVISVDIPLKKEELIRIIMSQPRKIESHPVRLFPYNDLKISCEEFYHVAYDAQNKATFTDHQYADFISAFGCESLPVSEKDRDIQDTALRTMSGAGHQHFIGFMRELLVNTGPEHLQSSLFEPWQYSDLKPSLRWDPYDDRRYALRWKEPSGDPIRTMRGANRLALEALPLFPTQPIERKLHTTGFSQSRNKDVLFTWPIWEIPLSIDAVRSLISLDELQKPLPNRESLSARGVIEIYRSQRITNGKYRNFTVATPV